MRQKVEQCLLLQNKMLTANAFVVEQIDVPSTFSAICTESAVQLGSKALRINKIATA